MGWIIEDAKAEQPTKASHSARPYVPTWRDHETWKGSRLTNAKSDSTLDDFLNGFNYRIIIWFFRQLFDVLDVLNGTVSIQNKN
jgi:hypothetical protein